MRLLRQERAPEGRGDEAEFEAYVARDGGRLLGFAILLTGDRHDAEDLVNLARDRWRARRRHGETFLTDLAVTSAASDATAALLERHELLRLCRTLPAQQRAVLVLRFWEDRSVEETAAVLGCTAGTVKSHTHRALARLRLALQDPPQMAASANWRETSC
jgi:DNA-directed RNA polymerase specialized sigma24 family protein